MTVRVAMVMAAAALVTVAVGVTVLVFVVMAAAALVAVAVRVFVVMAAAALVTMAVRVLVTVLVVMAAAALITVAVRVLMTMLMLVIIYCMLIAMGMLGNMSHGLVVMVLTAMAAGAALRMLAIIFNAVNTAVNFLIAAHIISAVTDIFQIMHIFLHYLLPPFCFVLSSSY